MRILAVMLLCEKDRRIARSTLEQVVDLFSEHELHVLLYDDGSTGRWGEVFARELGPRVKGTFHCVTGEKNKGFFRLAENVALLLRHAAASGHQWDYVVKVDPDLHFCDRQVASLFEGASLPRQGLTAPTFTMRRRDFVQCVADVLPGGLRRRNRAGVIDRKWQFSLGRKVWWAKYGRAALARGWRGELAPGSFWILAGQTLKELSTGGLLDGAGGELGLVFGDDVVLSMLVSSLGHPLVAIDSVLSGWSCSLFLAEGTTPDEVRARRYSFVHPLKETPWALALRQQLPLPAR